MWFLGHAIQPEAGELKIPPARSLHRSEVHSGTLACQNGAGAPGSRAPQLPSLEGQILRVAPP